MEKILKKIEEMSIEEKIGHRARVDFRIDDFRYIYETIINSEMNDFHKKEILKYFKGARLIKRSFDKKLAMEIATRARSKKAKEKIQNAVNMLRLQGDPITIYSVSKVGGVSYNTVKKYANEFDLM